MDLADIEPARSKLVFQPVQTVYKDWHSCYQRKTYDHASNRSQYLAWRIHESILPDFSRRVTRLHAFLAVLRSIRFSYFSP